MVAFDASGGIWLTTDGGDGALATQYQSAFSIGNFDTIPACLRTQTLATIVSNQCPNGLRVDSISLVGDLLHFALVSTPKLPTTFGGGTSDSFYVRFTPLKQSGNFTTQLHVRGMNILPDTSLPFDTLITITATATPEPPRLLSTVTQFNFDSLSTCGGLRDTSVVFVNTGCEPDTLTDVSTLGAGFSWLRDSLPIIIASGDSVRLRFRFVPPDSGSFSGTAMLTVTSMGLSQTPQLGFSGAGVRGTGVLEVQSTSLRAGSFSFCAGDTTLTDTLRNTGCDTLFLHGATLAGDTSFTLLNQLPQYLLPQDSAVVEIQFSPHRKGPHAATLSISTKDSSFNIPIAGIGLPGTKYIAADQSLRDFGSLYVCESRDTTITLTNPGCDTLIIFGDSIGGVNRSYQTDTTYPLVIAPNDSARVRVSFTADTSGQPTTISSVVFFRSNSDTGTVTIPMTAGIIRPGWLHLSLSTEDSAKSGQTVTYYVILQEGHASGVSLPVSALHFDLTHNDDLLGYMSGLVPSKTSGPSTAQVQHFDIAPVPQAGSSAPRNTIDSLTFKVYLADSNTTALALSNVTFDNTLHLPNDCIASIDDSGSAFTYINGCTDPSIRDFMLTGGVHVESVRPNPAKDQIEIVLGGVSEQLSPAVVCVMYDVLGRTILSGAGQSSGSGVETVALDVSGIPEGIYFLRIIAGNVHETRQIAIQR